MPLRHLSFEKIVRDTRAAQYREHELRFLRRLDAPRTAARRLSRTQSDERRVDSRRSQRVLRLHRPCDRGEPYCIFTVHAIVIPPRQYMQRRRVSTVLTAQCFSCQMISARSLIIAAVSLTVWLVALTSSHTTESIVSSSALTARAERMIDLISSIISSVTS